MTATPAVAVLTATVLLGGWLGTKYLMGERNNRMLVALHLVLAGFGLEVLVQLLRGLPGGLGAPASAGGATAALLLALAMLTGLLVPILAPARPRSIGPTLAIHATIAALGFGWLVVWALA